jgi:hypothetical protein
MERRPWNPEPTDEQQAPALIPQSAADKRRHPRLTPAGAQALIGHNPDLHLIDVTDDWVEFYASTYYTPGLPVQVQVDSAPPSQGEVVTCLLEETDSNLLEVRYRVRCRFLAGSAAR